MFDERTVRLLDFDPEPGLAFTYLYDFGDRNRSSSTVGNVLAPSTSVSAPVEQVGRGQGGGTGAISCDIHFDVDLAGVRAEIVSGLAYHAKGTFQKSVDVGRTIPHMCSVAGRRLRTSG